MTFYLRIVEGHNQGQRYPLNDRSILLGRAAFSGERAAGYLFFYEPTVSRQHAELIWDERQGVFLLHQRSKTNKTLCNGRSVQPGEPRALEAGSRVQLGLLKLVLEEE